MRLLEGFAGYLQTDGYDAYSKVCAERGLTAVGCWAHVRRKFDEALTVQSVNPEKRKNSLAAAGLTKIQALYRIERELQGLPAEERQRIRIARAGLLLEDLRGWLDQHLNLVPPQSALGKALQYANKQWDKLTVYV